MMTAPPLDSLVRILAKWAEPLPLKAVYVFGSRARGDATPMSDLDVAIKFDDLNITAEKMAAWSRENEAEFADLKKALGVRLSLHVEGFDAAWPAIEAAARDPILIFGRVSVVPTPKR
jgi:predicted nucleotidyltransferase